MTLRPWVSQGVPLRVRHNLTYSLSFKKHPPRRVSVHLNGWPAMNNTAPLIESEKRNERQIPGSAPPLLTSSRVSWRSSPQAQTSGSLRGRGPLRPGDTDVLRQPPRWQRGRRESSAPDPASNKRETLPEGSSSSRRTTRCRQENGRRSRRPSVLSFWPRDPL